MMAAAPPSAAWVRAQAAEREYWCPRDVVTHVQRRSEESARARWVAGLMGLTPDHTASKTVLDVACGPQALSAWPIWGLSRVVALDPLTFAPEDEAAYAAAGIHRVRLPAESYNPSERFDEVWAYNCLQHVMDPVAVLALMQRAASRRVRVFEWLDLPPSIVHLHTVTQPMIEDAFADWILEQATIGRATTPAWRQPFMAAVYRRPA